MWLHKLGVVAVALAALIESYFSAIHDGATAAQAVGVSILAPVLVLFAAKLAHDINVLDLKGWFQ